MGDVSFSTCDQGLLGSNALARLQPYHGCGRFQWVGWAFPAITLTVALLPVTALQPWPRLSLATGESVHSPIAG